MHTITKAEPDMRTTFAYCPRPTWRSDIAYQLQSDCFRLPVYTFAAFAAGGTLAVFGHALARVAGVGR